MLENIPIELRERAQWVLAGPDKRPLTVDVSGIKPASVTAPSTWLTFGAACHAARYFGLSVGFVLTADDPFVCIDLDAKMPETHPGKPESWTKPEDFARYRSIVQHFDTYTETSRSGVGLHVWAIGPDVGGFRRSGVELYSRDRYIICTGSVVFNKPIADRSDTIIAMAGQMRASRAKEIELEELPEDVGDFYVMRIAAYAENGDKFLSLWNGVMADYPSQSEADAALLTILAFYTDSNAQVRRMFRKSALGQREKATRDNVYINRSLKFIRARQIEERVQRDLTAITPFLTAIDHRETTQTEPEKPQAPAEYEHASETVIGDEDLLSPPSELDWPPGFLGAISQYVYSMSHHQAKEIAIITALGVLAGICGKSWNVNNSGLNLYLMLIARSGVGKNTIHDGIAKFYRSLQKINPLYGNFFNFNSYGSGEALEKHARERPSSINVVKEFGLTFKRLATESHGPMASLQGALVKYFDSSPDSVQEGRILSDKDRSLSMLETPIAYSIIGETTPKSFFENLTDTVLEGGLMSRILVIQYDGQRMPRNKNRPEPAPEMVNRLATIADRAMTLITRKEIVDVKFSNDALQMSDSYEAYITTQINKTNDEGIRHVYNRAIAKIFRVAALLAVADNYETPVISAAHWHWSQMLIQYNIEMFIYNKNAGNIGTDDSTRKQKLLNLCLEFLKKDPPASVKASMHNVGIIPQSWLAQRAYNLALFREGKGANINFRDTIAALKDTGELNELTKAELLPYSFNGRAYRIIKITNNAIDAANAVMLQR